MKDADASTHESRWCGGQHLHLPHDWQTDLPVSWFRCPGILVVDETHVMSNAEVRYLHQRIALRRARVQIAARAFSRCPDPDLLEASRVILRELNSVERERDRARLLARNLFPMIDRETWRDAGGDDQQGHYEGEHHASQIDEEIRSWDETQ